MPWPAPVAAKRAVEVDAEVGDVVEGTHGAEVVDEPCGGAHRAHGV